MTTDSSILAQKIPWTEEIHGLQAHGFVESRIRLSTPIRVCLSHQGMSCLVAGFLYAF